MNGSLPKVLCVSGRPRRRRHRHHHSHHRRRDRRRRHIASKCSNQSICFLWNIPFRLGLFGHRGLCCRDSGSLWADPSFFSLLAEGSQNREKQKRCDSCRSPWSTGMPHCQIGFGLGISRYCLPHGLVSEDDSMAVRALAFLDSGQRMIGGEHGGEDIA